VTSLFKHRVQVVISGAPHHREGLVPYQQYVRYLFRKQPRMTEQELFEAPYLDYLQAPLQPLMDNLESQTYETFEKDPIKYSQYELAVYHGTV
jgi:protein arginine N-methyltransferase 5